MKNNRKDNVNTFKQTIQLLKALLQYQHNKVNAVHKLETLIK